MADKRKWTLFIGAVMAVGLASFGCSDEDAVFLPDADPSTAPADCKNASTCKEADACKEGAGLAACKCVTDESYCHANASCNGIESCTYTCSTSAGTCDYAGCKNDPACKSGPGPGPGPSGNCTLTSATADDDGDGIPNGKETTTDPCKADSDGDTIPDGEEDLNHNGEFEPWLGETDPMDPADPADANTTAGKDKIAVKKAVCNADMLNGEAEALNKFRVAKLGNGVTYSKPSGGTTLPNFTSFEDTTNKVAGAFFGMSSKANGKEFLAVAFEDHPDLLLSSPIEEANFGTKVPNNAWLNNDIYARESKGAEPNYDRYQVVKDHYVDRYKYHLSLKDGVTLSQVRDAITGESLGSTGGVGDCSSSSNSAVLYLARSTFTVDGAPWYVFSFALACDNDVKNIATQLVMDDVLSGTLVAGNDQGTYEPYKDYLCQQELFGEASGSVDFIWVIDNSGSMKDELSNLTQTLAVFVDRLGKSGIDYRLGVTTTDSYTIDEWPTKGGYDALGDRLAQHTAYLDPVGMINGDGEPGGVPCMFVKADNTQVATAFPQRILRRNCNKNGISSYNICGYGYEDGFKSGVEVMRRMAYTEANNPEYYAYKQQFACQGVDPDKCININRCNSKDDALKYLIFVSDEESRQFKESVGVTEQAYQTFYDESSISMEICKTGYKLVVPVVEQDPENPNKNKNILEIAYDMMLGIPEGLTGETAATICNPEMKTKELLADYEVTEDMSPEELKAKADEWVEKNQDHKVENYYNMLMYYIQQYHKFAGSGGIAAFALVGDIGKNQNGACDELGESSDSTEGANYGLSYIHLARYLGALDENGTFTGKSGGFGSICNTNYETTVNSIFEDVQGRVASHPLRGYPISSTIRVAIAHDGSVTELKRGESKNGWNYDASQNAIVFTGMSDFGNDLSEYEVAISYVIWKKNAG